MMAMGVVVLTPTLVLMFKTKSHTLQRVAVLLEDVHVIANPLLDESREKCRKKTEDEGHEPEDIHANVGCRWFEIGEWGGRSRRDRELRSNGRDLAGNLIEEGIVLLEIILHFVFGSGFQVLFAVDYECGDDRRE